MNTFRKSMTFSNTVRPVSRIDNVSGLELNDEATQKANKPVIAHKIGRTIAKNKLFFGSVAGLTGLAAAILVGAAVTDPKAPKTKAEQDFTQVVSQNEMQSMQIVEGVTGDELVRDVYAARHQGGPATLTNGPIELAAAKFVDRQGTQHGVTSDGKPAYELHGGQTVYIPILTAEQAVHNTQLLEGHK